MPGNRTRNLHVLLPEPLYRRLRAEAERSQRPATDLAREAIDSWLVEQQRLLVHEQIRQYAMDAAGSEADLDSDLESAATEHLGRTRSTIGLRAAG